MKTILLCGYRIHESPELAIGLERDADGLTTIDRRIQELTQLGLEVICVVAGRSADEQLRHCSRIANVELVYDDDAQACLATNLRAGLEAVEDDGCFVIPVELPCPPEELWSFLKEEWRKIRFHTDYCVLQATQPEGAPWHLGFPLLITRKGNTELRDNPDIRSLVDARLKYLHLSPEVQPGLAPAKNAN